MVTSMIVQVTDATGDEVAALLDGPDLAAIPAGRWTALQVRTMLGLASKRASEGRRVSIANALLGLQGTPGAAVLQVERVDASGRLRLGR